MSTGDSQKELSAQQVVTRSAKNERVLSLRFDLRTMAMIGAGLLVIAAFLPWLDPDTQKLITRLRIVPLVEGWSSLLIGLITLVILALQRPDPRSTWVSLPAAALGLAAIFIAIASAISASNAVMDALNELNLEQAVMVPGAGILLTIIGGVVCVVAGLSHPPSPASEPRLDLRAGQPGLAMLAGVFVLVALFSGLIGAWIATSESDANAAGITPFPTELLGTPVLEVQITPLGDEPQVDFVPPDQVPTEDPGFVPPIPSDTPFVFPSDTPFEFPTATETVPPFFPTATSAPSATPTATATPTRTLPSSPLETPES
jgi:hypothetical protein